MLDECGDVFTAFLDQIIWMPLVLRLLALAWAGAIVAALIDEFGAVAHLPFLTAMGMTALLVGASFLWTAPETFEDDDQAERDQLAEDSTLDLLTSLPTYNLFSRRLNDEFARARRMGRNIPLIYNPRPS